MNVYESERDAGLAPLLNASGRVAFAASIEPVSPNEAAPLSFARATNLGQPDLFYFSSVLVSTGWNKNDDYFDPADTWAARASNEDKQVNFEHDAKDIVGHTTACRVVDVDGNPWVGDTPPAGFKVVDDNVLYRTWLSNPDRQKRMDGIIAGVAKGEWKVSMECLFAEFDYVMGPAGSYGVASAAGSTVVPRTKDTAFLTKHLRAYGGRGTYEGQRLGRVLRSFTFSGKGLVKNPANPESVILSSASAVATELQAVLARAKLAERTAAIRAVFGPEYAGLAEAHALALVELPDDRFAAVLATMEKVAARPAAPIPTPVLATASAAAPTRSRTGVARDALTHATPVLDAVTACPSAEPAGGEDVAAKISKLFTRANKRTR